MTTVKIDYPVDALVSYHYFRSEKKMAAVVAPGRLRLIGDSGAFSALTVGAPIVLDEYAGWVRRWQEHLFWAASLDVIGDPAATLRNWRVLRDRHGLTTVPTLHAGGPLEQLDLFAAEGATLVGLGGMAGNGQAQKALRWVAAVFRYARDRHPQMRFHLWGVTRREFLLNLPAWSADSSGLLGQGFRYCRLAVFDPATGLHRDVTLRAGGRGVYGLSGLLRGVYGVDPADLPDPRPANRHTLIQLTAACCQQYAAWLQRRHQVTAPAVLATSPTGVARPLPALTGPRLHLAETRDLLAVVSG